MSIGDILDTEIERRRLANADLIAAQETIEATIEQFNKLDEIHRSNEKVARLRLEDMYKESRHYTGKQVIVFSSAQTEKFPFYGGQTDDLCNPYFPITKAQNKTFDGIAPLEVPPTQTGAWARESVFTPTESSRRNPAIAAVQAFPDTSGEVGNGFCTGGTGGSNRTTCEAGGGVWTNPSYPAGATGTEKLRNALNAWKSVVQSLIDDAYNSPSEVTYWQNIMSKIDDILPSIQTDVTYPDHTQDFIPGSLADLARDYLIANATSIQTHVTNRADFLAKEAQIEEDLFFGVIKLRLHQANGSYAKLQAAKSQKATNKSIVDDNNAAIRSLNLLKIRSS